MSILPRTYGFRITEETFANCPAVVARVLVREDDGSSPINPRTEGEDSYWGAPKKIDGLALASLEIIKWADKEARYATDVQIRFDSVRFVDERLAKRLLRTMQRINRELTKTNAREPGDVLMAVAKAIGASWIVAPNGPERGNFYTDCEWRFDDLDIARDTFRALIAKLIAPVEAKQAEERAREKAAEAARQTEVASN